LFRTFPLQSVSSAPNKPAISTATHFCRCVEFEKLGGLAELRPPMTIEADLRTVTRVALRNYKSIAACDVE